MGNQSWPNSWKRMGGQGRLTLTEIHSQLEGYANSYVAATLDKHSIQGCFSFDDYSSRRRENCDWHAIARRLVYVAAAFGLKSAVDGWCNDPTEPTCLLQPRLLQNPRFLPRILGNRFVNHAGSSLKLVPAGLQHFTRNIALQKASGGVARCHFCMSSASPLLGSNAPLPSPGAAVPVPDSPAPAVVSSATTSRPLSRLLTCHARVLFESEETGPCRGEHFHCNGAKACRATEKGSCNNQR